MREGGDHTGTSETGASGLRGRIAWLKARLAGREDSEHEQQIIRIVTITGMYLYMLWAPFPPEERPWVVYWSTVIFLVGMVVAVGLFLHLLARPQVSPVRRLIGILTDTSGVNAAMLIGGTATTPFYPILLWIVFGHGFRYGRFYLFTAAVLSLLMFLVVTTYNEQWHRFPILSSSLILALIILPAYVSVLLGKLTDALARAEEANRIKSRFLAHMSHEFRTPLNAIIGMSEVLLRTRLSREQRDYAATIRNAADSLLTLVNAVLDLARIESGRLAVAVQPFDLDRKLAQLRAMLRPSAREKGLYLRLRFDPRIPPRLEGALEPLHQVLQNLLANAVKFTDRGGVMLRVERLDAEGDRIWLRFEVRDTGIGIEPEEQERIFERFARSRAVQRAGVGGTGLGLAIARELVQLMGGRIGVSSQPGRGSTFWFEVPFRPLAEDDDGRIQGTVAILAPPEPGLALCQQLREEGLDARLSVGPTGVIDTLRRARGRRCVLLLPGAELPSTAEFAARIDALEHAEPIDILGLGMEEGEQALPLLANLPRDAEGELLRRMLRLALAPFEREGESAEAEGGRRQQVRGADILLAEDNPVNQKVITRLLEQAGHRVEVVDDGFGVVERLEERRFDIVFIDVNMPGMSGPETVKMLRFTFDPEELPPIVALSADATAQTREECLALGFSRYLTKPVELDRLLATIDELVASRKVGSGDPRSHTSEAEEPVSEVVVLHPSAQRTAPVLDEAKLESLAGLDRDDGFLESLVAHFLEDGGALVARLEDAAARRDLRAYRDAAHALKSSAAHIGAQALYERCQAWRGLDDHALAMRVAAEAQSIRHEFARARQALQSFLARSRPASRHSGGRHG